MNIVTTETKELSIRYSLLISQYSVTEKAAQFWNHIKSIEEELNQMIDDHKLSIARLLHPLFAEHKIPFRQKINDSNIFWFSTYDLQNGYILLNKIVNDYIKLCIHKV